uniref:Uncharacterized protein n=1 Tax=Populus trichocarpa TaxID=3694 RepID=A0A2K2AXZ8_POPTR
MKTNKVSCGISITKQLCVASDNSRWCYCVCKLLTYLLKRMLGEDQMWKYFRQFNKPISLINLTEEIACPNPDNSLILQLI